MYQEDIALDMLLPLWDHWYWGEVAREEQDSLVLAPNRIVAEFNPESVMVTGDGWAACMFEVTRTEINKRRIGNLQFDSS